MLAGDRWFPPAHCCQRSVDALVVGEDSLLTSDNSGSVLEWPLPNPEDILENAESEWEEEDSEAEEAEPQAEEEEPSADVAEPHANPWPGSPTADGRGIWIKSIQVC
jgi:hypothetical protein